MKKYLLENILLPFGDLLLGNSFIENLKYLRKQVKLSENELLQLQEDKLKKLLKHATQKSPYYKALKIQPTENVIDWLKRFPILDKNILKTKEDLIISAPRRKLIRQNSSGSTGVQSTVYSTKREQSINRATQILWWEWAGYKIGNPILQTGINPERTVIKKVKDILLNTYYIQAFSHSKEDIARALNWADRQKDPFLAGYASSLFVFALYAKEANLDVSFIGAVSWGDKLFDHYRRTIEDVFSVNLKETYGSAEGLMMAAQADVDFMYIMSPNVYLEILDDNDNEVAEGELGNVIVTNLNAMAMPLIRYKIGDLAIKLPKSTYPVNRQLQLPLLQKVIGRDTDLVKTATGKYMVVHSFTGIFEHVPEIIQFCVIQNDLTGITINYIPGKGFNPGLLENIQIQILNYLKEDFVIDFREVDYIPPTKSGKPQLIISNLIIKEYVPGTKAPMDLYLKTD